MESMQAWLMAEMVDDGLVTLEQALHWHLGAKQFVGLALNAIKMVREGRPEDNPSTEAVVVVGNACTAADLVEALHLEAFV